MKLYCDGNEKSLLNARIDGMQSADGTRSTQTCAMYKHTKSVSRIEKATDYRNELLALLSQTQEAGVQGGLQPTNYFAFRQEAFPIWKKMYVETVIFFKNFIFVNLTLFRYNGIKLDGLDVSSYYLERLNLNLIENLLLGHGNTSQGKQ